ncbi:MAG: hypothetical protein AAF561_01650 [Planctomycetota bacterium]
MRATWLRIIVLTWQAVWLLAIVPGHMRGAIRLPGAERAEVVVADPAVQAKCCSTSQQGDQPEEPVPSGGKCAVCHVVAMHVVAVAYTLNHPALAFANKLGDDVAESAEVSWVRAVRTSRGPPIVT